MTKARIARLISALPSKRRTNIDEAANWVASSVDWYRFMRKMPKEPTPKQIAERVEEFALAIANLRRVVGSFDVFTTINVIREFDKLEGALPAFKALIESLSDDLLHQSAHEAAQSLRRGAKPKRRRQPNESVRQLAEDLATIYFEVTSREPGKSKSAGYFLEFMQEIFDIAGVGEIDSGHYAKGAAQGWSQREQGRRMARLLERQKRYDQTP